MAKAKTPRAKTTKTPEAKKPKTSQAKGRAPQKTAKVAAKRKGAAPEPKARARSAPKAHAKASGGAVERVTVADVVGLARGLRGASPAIVAAIEKIARAPSWEKLGPQTIATTCHRPSAPETVIVGDLRVSGNLLVATGKHDGGTLIVLGNVHARNVAVGAGWSLVCTGDLHAEEVIASCAADSVTYVGGRVGAHLLDSGSGAWLTMFADRAALRATHVSGYVMSAKGAVWEPKRKVDVTDVVIDDAIETEEWDAMDADDRKGEQKADYVRVDTDAVLRIVGKGGSVLREARRGRAG